MGILINGTCKQQNKFILHKSYLHFLRDAVYFTGKNNFCMKIFLYKRPGNNEFNLRSPNLDSIRKTDKK